MAWRQCVGFAGFGEACRHAEIEERGGSDEAALGSHKDH
jgi:hypothetical protein